MDRIRHIGFVGLMIFFACLMVYQVKKKGNYRELMLSDEFNNEVLDVYSERSYHYLLLSGIPDRVQIRESQSIDQKDEIKRLQQVLRPGNTILKRACSDTIAVNQKGDFYYFLAEHVVFDSSLHTAAQLEAYGKRRRIATVNNDCY